MGTRKGKTKKGEMKKAEMKEMGTTRKLKGGGGAQGEEEGLLTIRS